MFAKKEDREPIPQINWLIRHTFCKSKTIPKFGHQEVLSSTTRPPNNLSIDSEIINWKMGQADVTLQALASKDWKCQFDQAEVIWSFRLRKPSSEPRWIWPYKFLPRWIVEICLRQCLSRWRSKKGPFGKIFWADLICNFSSSAPLPLFPVHLNAEPGRVLRSNIGAPAWLWVVQSNLDILHYQQGTSRSQHLLLRGSKLDLFKVRECLNKRQPQRPYNIIQLV